MCYLLHVAVNVRVNCIFTHFFCTKDHVYLLVKVVVMLGHLTLSPKFTEHVTYSELITLSAVVSQVAVFVPDPTPLPSLIMRIETLALPQTVTEQLTLTA